MNIKCKVYSYFKTTGLTCCLASKHIHDNPFLPSLPKYMKTGNLSLGRPREVANVSSSFKDLWRCLPSPTVSTVRSLKARLHWHVSRHLTFRKNPVVGQQRKSNPCAFLCETQRLKMSAWPCLFSMLSCNSSCILNFHLWIKLKLEVTHLSLEMP